MVSPVVLRNRNVGALPALRNQETRNAPHRTADEVQTSIESFERKNDECSNKGNETDREHDRHEVPSNLMEYVHGASKEWGGKEHGNGKS